MAEHHAAQIEELLAPLQALPPFGGWSIAEDCAHLIVTHILEERPACVLELGSGLSTLIMAHALRKSGAGKLISIEHDEKYYGETQALLRAHGLAEWVELRLCPLEPVGPEQSLWYRMEKLPDASVDMLVIDGPPGHIAPQARYPALGMLWEALKIHALIILDDASRADEIAAVARWLREHHGLSHEYRPTQKGTSVLRRNA